ncbi:MAG TPA: TonB-dependent receptor [Nevskiaceae bacterium]|nr:TonB-dependent receptor [Nevskiaceae bacterium]
MRLKACAAAAALMLPFNPAAAADEPAADDAAPIVLLPMQVRGEREAAPVSDVPSSYTRISGDELRARGATDLRSALALAAGINVAPGGDEGPAGAAPGLLGQRETDDFMLAIDGVPVGGVFSAPFAAIDLAGVERIEVLRGASPVVLGAGAFAGVINIVHYAAGADGDHVAVGGSTYGSLDGAARVALPALGAWQQSLIASGQRQGYSDPRQNVHREHLLYRGGRSLDAGDVHLDVDALDLRQQPGSPSPDGSSPDVNVNPSDAALEDQRLRVAAGFEQVRGDGRWSATLSASRALHRGVQGFLRNPSAGDSGDALDGLLDPGDDDDDDSGNAAGFRQQRGVTDAYADAHYSRSYDSGLGLLAGADLLYGSAHLQSHGFGYDVDPSGANPPSSAGLADAGYSDVQDQREIAGLYSQLALRLPRRLNLYAGLRANYAHESLDTAALEDGAYATGRDRRSDTRLGAVAGASWRLLRDDEADDGVLLYADYRGSSQPAQLDFGPEVESRSILAPETTQNVELGIKSILFDGHVELELSALAAHFDHLVLAQQVNGEPALVNAGAENFRALQLEGGVALADHLHLTANLSLQQARYDQFLTLDDDGNAIQLQGRELPLSPRQLAALGLVYAPAEGFQAALIGNYRGRRFLDNANTRAAGGYATWEASAGWRMHGWELRVAGENLGNRRDPVALSELGDEQLYLLPARRVRLGLSVDFE